MVVTVRNVTVKTEAFKNLRSLEKITLGLNAQIAEDAFSECPMLTNPIAK